MTTPNACAKLQRRQRLIALAVFALCVIIAAAGLAWVLGPAYLAAAQYEPQEGDIVFQSMPHTPLIDAIEGASECPLSHCGIVGKKEGQWVIYEALHGVEITPLKAFLWRGRQGGFAVYRFKESYRPQIPATLAAVQKYLGRPYDIRYELDDEKIYCSELIYKAWRDVTGQELGKLVRLGDLKWQPYESTIRQLEGGEPPLDRMMIAPRDLALAPQLELVQAYQIEVPKAGDR
jgi:hypothetical protein